jgi:glycerol-3-phosphate O-acyltransferase/dihydroxyacetone phosphate acyltransferase
MISPKTSIALPKGIGEAIVAEVISDVALRLTKPFDGEAAITALTVVDETGNIIGSEFKLVPHVDQSSMFNSVVDRLAKNQAVGIFPEGGSHDRSEMLPLKAGVAIMALETLVKYPGTKLKVIPTGLHYFHADKVRILILLSFSFVPGLCWNMENQSKSLLNW